MAVFSDIDQQIAQLRALLGEHVASADLARVLSAGGPDAAHRAVRATAAVIRELTVVQSCAAAVIAAHSERERGQGGFAQGQGHRSAVTLVQEETGASRADVARRIRVGTDLLEPAGPGGEGDVAAAGVSVAASREPWHRALSSALLAGQIVTDQHDAIRRGLGEPPVDDEPTRDAWSLAAAQLAAGAAEYPLEELRAAARALRDELDPNGARRRFDERFEGRSFRMWTDADGIHRGSVRFDDFGAAWWRTIADAAMRPRRGGPRFVDEAEQARAQALADDPRSPGQLEYDLLVDTLRAGTLAEPEQVFGTRQAGVRVVITAAAMHTVAVAGVEGEAAPGHAGVGHTEDHTQTLPAWLLEQHACDVGERACITDRVGNPLYLGREQRLFSPHQKLGLAVRDGGCRWRGCSRPASFCEAHHIDEFAAERGRTDVDRGILLCRFHHMQLHHGGWRITRAGSDDFVLHPPRGDAIPLPRRPHLRYAWADADPPPRRFHPAT